MNTKIDHSCTDEIVCPYCGYEYSDSWEFEDSSEDIDLLECEDCGKSFYANRMVEITYSTEKATYGTCLGCNEENVVIEDYVSSNGCYNDLCIKCGDKKKIEFRNNYFSELRKRKD